MKCYKNLNDYFKHNARPAPQTEQVKKNMVSKQVSTGRNRVDPDNIEA